MTAVFLGISIKQQRKHPPSDFTHQNVKEITHESNLGVQRVEKVGRSVPALRKLPPVVSGVENLRAEAEPVLPRGEEGANVWQGACSDRGGGGGVTCSHLTEGCHDRRRAQLRGGGAVTCSQKTAMRVHVRCIMDATLRMRHPTVEASIFIFQGASLPTRQRGEASLTGT